MNTNSQFLTLRDAEADILNLASSAWDQWGRTNDQQDKGFAEGLDKALEILSRVTESQGWQPIETAPRDGTMVLACIEPKTGQGFSGGWLREFEIWLAPQTVRFGGFHPNAPGKRQWRNADGKPVSPTHWMPLPEPPQEASNA